MKLRWNRLLALALALIAGVAAFAPMGSVALAKTKEAAKVDKVEAARKKLPVEDPVKFTVQTSKSAKYLFMDEYRGDRLKKWKASKYSKVEGNTRVWSVSYKFKKAGTYTLVFGASTDGKVIGLTRKITVWTNNDPAVKSIKLNASGTKKIAAGETFTLKATLSPKGASSNLKWKSSKKSVATVSSKGKVTAVKKGTATITVTSENGTKATVKIKVTKAKKPAATPTPTPKPTATPKPTPTPEPEGEKLPYSEDLSAYMGKKIEDVAVSLGLPKDSVKKNNLTAYYDLGMEGSRGLVQEVEYGLYAELSSHNVRNIMLAENGKARDRAYSIFGAKLGMDEQTAVNALLSSGLVIKNHREEYGEYYFKHPDYVDNKYDITLAINKDTGKVLYIEYIDFTVQ